MFTTFIILIQFLFSIVIGIYFLTALKEKQGSKDAIIKNSEKEMERLKKMRQLRLTEPLSEKTRPACFGDIIGQGQGIRALKAALCGPNPQHVIIYGPPGIGKTAAARIILEEAKKNPLSPFSHEAKFIEADATVMRFDERNIADPLIGSVHDPIYQGAGAYGHAGIPQPKPGAVTKAHGGILFIDEIGELHPIQMNKLLKVLEDRKVFLESAYYAAEDPNIPLHVHEIFRHGLPADFRMIGATTRNPDDIPPAIRSRCVEVYFRPLNESELAKIAYNAAMKGGFKIDSGVAELVAHYSLNGRDAVNMMQMGGSLCMVEGHGVITLKDIEWVIEVGKYNPRIENKVSSLWRKGCVNGLAVSGMSGGIVIEIEASVTISHDGGTHIELCGITEEEQIDAGSRKLKRTATAKAAVKNAVSVLKNLFGIDLCGYTVNINIPGGIPVDGPSAGTAIFTALYSAVMDIPVDGKIAMTGELSINGRIKPVGGVAAKIEAAKAAGAKAVYIPTDNWQKIFEDLSIAVIPVDNIAKLHSHLFGVVTTEEKSSGFISASGI